MKIAVCSQNRRTVTPHAGRCRNFLVYEVLDGQVGLPVTLELSITETLHELDGEKPHPLDGIQVLLAASMGECARAKLARRGILGLITDVEDPGEAARRCASGELPSMAAAGAGTCSCSH